MDYSLLKNIVEAALMAAGNPLTIDQLCALFGDQDGPPRQEIRAVLQTLQEDYEGRGIEIREVASGFRIQVRETMSQWLIKLWEERPPRYSRALMETLAIIAYRQPVTRGDIEDIRGVSVTTHIMRTLLERDWIKVVGHRDVPGKPALFSTTRMFLDYFSLKKLDDLPPLAELAALEPIDLQLELGTADQVQQPHNENPEDNAESVEATEGTVDDEPSAATDEADEFSVEDDAEEQAVSEDEIAAAAARIDAIAAELSGKNDQESEVDVPPGAVQPLVGLNAPGVEPPEPATVTSLDEVRAAAAGTDNQGVADGSDELRNDQAAKVVPLKTP